jgi:hypothetical protein
VAGANKPDGKDPGQRVSFTRAGADRIARAVRVVEAGNRDGQPLRFDPRRPPGRGGGGSIFRTATFSGDWHKDTTTTITFTNVTVTPQTATAHNIFCGIAGGDVGVVQDELKEWYLISWEMDEICTTRVIDIQVELNTTNCEIYRTLVTSEQKFLRLTFPFATCSTATTPG